MSEGPPPTTPSEQPPVPPAEPTPVAYAPPPGPAAVAPAPMKKGFAVTSLVLGIVAIPGALIPFVGLGSAFIGLVGLVFGVVAILLATQNKAGGKVMAIVGASISALAIVIGIASTAVGTKAVDDALDDLGDITFSAEPAPSSSDAEAPTSEATAPADASEVGSIDDPAAIGDGTVWTFTNGDDEWEITYDTIEVVDGYDGKVVVVTGTATPTAISEGDLSSWTSFPSIGWIADGATVEDTYDSPESDKYADDYRNYLDLEATVGTEMKFYSTTGLPDGVVPDLMTVEALFNFSDSGALYFATGL